MAFKYKLLLIVTPLIVVLDQVTKWLILQNLPLHTAISIIPGFFDIVHVRNTGAAFGMFASSDQSFREPFFYFVAAVAVFVLLGLLRKITPKEKVMAWVVTLVAGGLLGNLIDRLRFGNVVDFLSFHWRDAEANWNIFGLALHFRWEWPSFNVADSAITVAMILLVLNMLIWEKRT